MGHPAAVATLLHREKDPVHIYIEDGVIQFLVIESSPRIPREAGIGEHNVKLALVPFDLREQAIEIGSFDTSPCTPVILLPISFTAAANSGSRRPVMKTYAPLFTNYCAVARPMPLLPPVISAIFPSSLLIYFFLVFI
jgi:hypothetical protein